MTADSEYVLEHFREGPEFTLYRARKRGDPMPLLAIAPSEPPSPQNLRRLEHEYSLADELEPTWAAMPVALTRHEGRTILVLADPGGEPLDLILERYSEQPLDLARNLRLAINLAMALGHVHQRGLIHKDVKPENVLVDHAHNVWLTGFGIASWLPRERQAHAPPEIISGTLAYMSPEQTAQMNRSMDTRSDLYSLGVTLYQLLTGVLPFSAADPQEWVHCHIARRPVAPADRCGVSEPLSAIVMKLLAKNADERYQTAASLEADLRRCSLQWQAHGRIDTFPLGTDDRSDQLLMTEKSHEVRLREERTLDSLATAGPLSGQLDVESVVKASQALSSELLLPRLIEKLVRIAVEHAGAERGLLILIHGGESRIVAEASTGAGKAQVIVQQSVVTPNDIPQTVLQRVIRTQQSVLLDDALADSLYFRDEYVQRNRSRSVLCLPIVKQTKLIGVLYLENNLTPCAFTPDRVTVLQLLASQATISIENADLYSDLQKEGQNLRLIVDTVPGFLCTMTAMGAVEFVNQGIIDYTGCTIGQLSDWRPLLHADECERVMMRWMHSVTTGEPYEIEHRILGGDGVYRWFGVRGLPVRDAEGSVLRWYVMITDIDERKKTHEKLQRSEAFLAQGQSISQTGSFGWNVSSGEIYWSEGTFNITECDGADKPTFDLLFQRIHPDDRDFVRQTVDHATMAKADFDIQHRLLMPDGRIKHVHIIGRGLQTASGEVEFVGAVTDITAAKNAEQKIRQSESEFRQILDFAPQHVYVLGTNPSRMRLYVNKAALDYLGLTFEEWQTRDLRDLIHPEDWARTMSGEQNQLAAGLPHEVELRLRRKDGKYRWFLSRRNPLRDEHGHLTRWYTAATDIEDRKVAEQRLQEENVALREEVDKASMFEEIVGTSAPLKVVLSSISKVAPTDSGVLITGETGTGKELAARAIHRRSQRSLHPFVSVNCAVIPRDLIVSELFGHEKGAFTGATQRRLGRFEMAEQGTIFLDEVGELTAETQVALLRVLQEHEFERMGGTDSIRTDVRVIAATNRDLEEDMESGKFRRDLFYRLNVFPIELPPLRKRSEDIPLLITYFLNRYARKAGRRFTAIDKKSLSLLQSYTWPGNIRELQNVIERSVIVSESQTFSVDASWLSHRPSALDMHFQPSLLKRLPAQEKAVIEAALRECGGRVYGPSGAAAKLGISRTTLESKIKSLKIDKNRFKGRNSQKDQ